MGPTAFEPLWRPYGIQYPHTQGVEDHGQISKCPHRTAPRDITGGGPCNVKNSSKPMVTRENSNEAADRKHLTASAIE